MATTDIGREGEARVAAWLKKHKYKIRDMNWRNRWCEIDIIAEKSKVIFFVEVKFRTSSNWGDGFDAVGHDKLDRMSRAAEAWVAINNWSGEYELLVVSVDADDIELRQLY